MKPPRMLSPGEVAIWLNVGQRTVRRLIREGAFPVLRVNERVLRVSETDLAVWVATRGRNSPQGATSDGRAA